MRKKKVASDVLKYTKEIDIKGTKWELEVDANTQNLLTLGTGDIKFFLDKRKKIFKVEKEGKEILLSEHTRKIIEGGNFEELEKQLGEQAVM